MVVLTIAYSRVFHIWRGGLDDMMRRLKKDWPFHLLLLPGVILTFIFSYMPMYGLVMSFQDFNPGLGFLHSKWVGWDNFRLVFSQPQFIKTIYNTLFISIFKIAIGVVCSVTFALLLNEVRHPFYKRLSQTIVYIPNFISWVIMAGIMYNILASDGIVNTLIGFFRHAARPVPLQHERVPVDHHLVGCVENLRVQHGGVSGGHHLDRSGIV